MKPYRFPQAPSKERGSTLLLAAFALVILLGMGALAIDVATLYVARTEAQRAADAAALAGAKVFVDAGCSNDATCDGFKPQARTQAKAVGDANEVFGQLANIADTDVVITDDTRNPQVQVTIRRAVPTFLAGALQRFLGSSGSSSNIVAKATAEAFNPSGSSAQFSSACLKPWIFPNSTPDGKPILTAGGTIADAALIGTSFTWYAGGDASNYRKIKLAPAEDPAQYQPNIETCNPAQHQSGDQMSKLPDNARGTQAGLNDLINSPGQDDINGPPFLVTPGSSNPLVQAGVITTTNRVTTSSSIVSVPLYSSCLGGQCTILGFMQLFIQSYAGDEGEGGGGGSEGGGGGHGGGGGVDGIKATILNIAGSSAVGATPVVGGGASLLPVRLIQNQ
ncbi:MAG TPA: pilus assembly protein TadG-related protein [Terriglobales bacterium]|nr:pilus assembly protein TadG-related protein [Terriglobales bacterium]